MNEQQRGRTLKQKDYLIRTIRKAMGLSLDKLSKLANVEYYTAYRVDIGLSINAEKARKIANALNISPDVLFYSMGQLPEDKIELMKKDPISFKEKIDELSDQPWRLTKTDDYIQTIKDKVHQTKVSPEISKMLSQLKPTE